MAILLQQINFRFYMQHNFKMNWNKYRQKYRNTEMEHHHSNTWHAVVNMTFWSMDNVGVWSCVLLYQLPWLVAIFSVPPDLVWSVVGVSCKCQRSLTPFPSSIAYWDIVVCTGVSTITQEHKCSPSWRYTCCYTLLSWQGFGDTM